jgi:hypothetical protein
VPAEATPLPSPLALAELREGDYHPLGSAYVDGEGDVWVSWPDGSGSWYSRASLCTPAAGRPSRLAVSRRGLLAAYLGPEECDLIAAESYDASPTHWRDRRQAAARAVAERGARRRSAELRGGRSRPPVLFTMLAHLPDLRAGDLLLLDPERRYVSAEGPWPLYLLPSGGALILWDDWDVRRAASDAPSSGWPLDASQSSLAGYKVRELGPRIRGVLPADLGGGRWAALLGRLRAGAGLPEAQP